MYCTRIISTYCAISDDRIRRLARRPHVYLFSLLTWAGETAVTTGEHDRQWGYELVTLLVWRSCILLLSKPISDITTAFVRPVFRYFSSRCLTVQLSVNRYCLWLLRMYGFEDDNVNTFICICNNLRFCLAYYPNLQDCADTNLQHRWIGPMIINWSAMSVYTFPGVFVPLHISRTTMSKLHQMFHACCLWPWLGPPTPNAGICYVYFRFCEWRHVCPWSARQRQVGASTQNYSPGGSTGAGTESDAIARLFSCANVRQAKRTHAMWMF